MSTISRAPESSTLLKRHQGMQYKLLKENTTSIKPLTLRFKVDYVAGLSLLCFRWYNFVSFNKLITSLSPGSWRYGHFFKSQFHPLEKIPLQLCCVAFILSPTTSILDWTRESPRTELCPYQTKHNIMSDCIIKPCRVALKKLNLTHVSLTSTSKYSNAN